MSLHGTKRLLDKRGRPYSRRDKKGRKKALRKAKARTSQIVDPWPAVDARIDTTTLLSKLPDDERAAATLHYIAGFTHREVATILHQSRAAVAKLLDRAVQRMMFFSCL